MHEPVGRVQFKDFEKFTSAYLFQIAQEKSCGYLLIIYLKKSQEKLAICEFLWSLTIQNAWFVSSFCSELTLLHCFKAKNCTALNQSEWINFFMYIIIGWKVLMIKKDRIKPFECTLLKVDFQVSI